ncbi:MAG: hypothetical protein CJD30_07385 [Sulfuricurvum sp. PD_MW2]|uniref:hypothetical protein n=1 Tax=Sulfuricurvum sp. PD_MW2 TaxID=2027917 RepID=UPI000C0679D6|nr:hypothetical protein [Sulfuricurvum sp. PD_MW2]PHM17210.1 MAG: hypothetical protein CJD30_07385 [Sulfuricurvum sp. PD_MW2]
MPLIKCYECEKEISDKALSCPHCGAPATSEPKEEEPTIELNKKDNIAPKTNEASKGGEAFSVIFTSLFILIVIVIFIRSCSGSDDKVKPATSEVDAPADVTVTDAQKIAAKELISANGYTCDSIDGMNRFFTSEGYHVYCNDHRYNYDIENKGGNWIVSVK